MPEAMEPMMYPWLPYLGYQFAHEEVGWDATSQLSAEWNEWNEWNPASSNNSTTCTDSPVQSFLAAQYCVACFALSSGIVWFLVCYLPKVMLSPVCLTARFWIISSSRSALSFMMSLLAIKTLAQCSTPWLCFAPILAKPCSLCVMVCFWELGFHAHSRAAKP